MPNHFKRYQSNPILMAKDLPYPANTVFNPGVAEVGGEVVLLLRVEDRRGISHLTVARSHNGVDEWRIEREPLLVPGVPEYRYEEWGCEDARITWLEERKEWVICYTAYSRFGPAVGMAHTRDFDSIESRSMPLPPNNKDAAVFPERISGRWWMLHRPLTDGQEHIWDACSEDLIYWGKPTCLLLERSGPWWDALKIGVGAPPIRTPQGWLLIYHGVKELAHRPIYRLGLALLKGDNPRKVIARTSEWVFGPHEWYERNGDVPNVVYTCGALLRGDEVWMYYGAADSSVCLATARLDDLLTLVHEPNG